MTAPHGELPLSGLEAVYDELAQAIDHAGPGKSELFLVKLALLQAQAVGDAQEVRGMIDAALRDL